MKGNQDVKLKELYKQMAELTLPECRFVCRVPFSCCSPEMTKAYAKKVWNVKLKETGHPKLLFMSEKGCIVEPYLRPFCTMHTCEYVRHL